MGQVAELRSKDDQPEEGPNNLTLEYTLNGMAPWQKVAILATVLLASAVFLTELLKPIAI